MSGFQPLIDAYRNATARLDHLLFATPYVASTLTPVGQIHFMRSGTGERWLAVGIPSRHETAAVRIVRDGLADVLAWLGEKDPLWLTVAERHYGGAS